MVWAGCRILLFVWEYESRQLCNSRCCYTTVGTAHHGGRLCVRMCVNDYSDFIKRLESVTDERAFCRYKVISCTHVFCFTCIFFSSFLIYLAVRFVNLFYFHGFIILFWLLAWHILYFGFRLSLQFSVVTLEFPVVMQLSAYLQHNSGQTFFSSTKGTSPSVIPFLPYVAGDNPSVLCFLLMYFLAIL